MTINPFRSATLLVPTGLILVTLAMAFGDDASKTQSTAALQQILKWDGRVQEPPSADVVRRAWPELERMANDGNADAQFRLAMLMFIRNTEHQGQYDADTIVKWLSAAAKQDYRFALIELASCHKVGFGVPSNRDRAVQLLRRAISPDDGEAEHQIGLIRFESKDYAQARSWFQKAAARNETAAVYNLGYLDYHGFGGPKDYRSARRHFVQAAEQDHGAAMAYLGEMSLYGLAGPTDRAAAMRWYRKAAARGNALAQYNLGVDCFERGLLIDAERYFRQAAEQNRVDAIQNLGVITFQRGDLEEAEQWFQRAVELGSSEAILQLAAVRRQQTLRDSVLERFNF